MTAHEHGPFAFDGKGRRVCTDCREYVEAEPIQRDTVSWRRFWAFVVPGLVLVGLAVAAFIRSQS